MQQLRDLKEWRMHACYTGYWGHQASSSSNGTLLLKIFSLARALLAQHTKQVMFMMDLN